MLALPKIQLCLPGERYLFVEWLHIVERDQLRLKSRVEDSEVDSFFNCNQNYNNNKKILVISTFLTATNLFELTQTASITTQKVLIEVE